MTVGILFFNYFYIQLVVDKKIPLWQYCYMKTFYDSVLDCLREAKDKLGSVAKLSDLTGVPSNTITRWLNGDRSPGLAEIGRIMDKIGINISEPGIDITSYEMIPKVDAKAGAGSSLITDNRIQGLYAFRRDFLQRTGLKGKNCVLFDVMGESMQPLIMDKDTILVDTAQKELRDGKIFLVTLGDELLVKMIQRTPKGCLLVSQNPNFAPIPVESGEEGTFMVHGRVCWFGRVL